MARRIRVHVRHKPDRKHLLLYYIDPDTGREVSKSAGTDSLRQADRAAATWEAELIVKRGALGASWQHFRQRFEDEHLAALKSRKSYVTALNHFERLIKVDDLEDISGGTMSTFQAELLREKRPLSSIAGYMSHMRVALRWGERVGLIPRAPIVKPPSITQRNMMRGRPLSADEFAAMLDAVYKVRRHDVRAWRRLLELFWYSGLRLSEGISLSWDEPPIRVDLEAEPYPQIVIYGEAQKSGQDEAIPIAPDFAAWLRQTPPRDRTGRVAPVRNAVGKLYVPEKAGGIISEIGYQAALIVSDPGKRMKYASAHDLRRSFGTRWAKRVRPVTLQRMMRHSNIETTLRYYVGLSNADIGADLYIYSNVPADVPKKKTAREITGKRASESQ